MAILLRALRISWFCIAAASGLGLILASFAGRPAIRPGLLEELLGGDSSCWDIGTENCTMPGGSCSTTVCGFNTVANSFTCPGGYDYAQYVNPREICASVDTGFYNCYSGPGQGKNNGVTTCWLRFNCLVTSLYDPNQKNDCTFNYDLSLMCCQGDPNSYPTNPPGSQFYRPLVGGPGCKSGS
jgi:hypothetical protein